MDLYSISFILKLNSIWNCAAYLAHNELVCWIYVRLANWLSKYRNPVAQSLTLHGVVHKVQHVNKKKNDWNMQFDLFDETGSGTDRGTDTETDTETDSGDRQDKALGKRNNVHSQRARSGPDIIIMQLPHTHTHRRRDGVACSNASCCGIWPAKRQVQPLSIRRSANSQSALN